MFIIDKAPTLRWPAGGRMYRTDTEHFDSFLAATICSRLETTVRSEERAAVCHQLSTDMDTRSPAMEPLNIEIPGKTANGGTSGRYMGVLLDENG